MMQLLSKVPEAKLYASLIYMCIMTMVVLQYAAKLKVQKQSGLGEVQEEEGGGGNYLEQLKRKRDYRRRRQTYRAKNVHITRKTPREVSQRFSESARHVRIHGTTIIIIMV